MGFKGWGVRAWGFVLGTAMGTAAAAQVGVAFTDSRPAGEAQSRYLSVSVFSCDYFIREVSDEGRPVERGAALRERIGAALAQAQGAHRLELQSYRVFLNYGSAEFASAISSASVSVGGAPVGRTAPRPKCGREKTPHGWFDPAETTNGNPPLVVEIAASFDGQPLVVRSVYSPAVPLSPLAKLIPASKAKKNLADAKAAPEVAAAMARANDALLAQVQAKLAGR